MTKLEYNFTNDTLFKMLFVKYPHLLKRLVANLLRIDYKRIGQFVITNPEMPPETMGDKFCKLDINMIVDGQRVNLEIQVHNDGDYAERALYYWAREFSSSLAEGEDYRKLPRTVLISILAYKMFDCEEYYSEFGNLEVTRHTPLTDKQAMYFFELPKLPKEINVGDELALWLALFKAETEEQLQSLQETEVSVMEQAIEAYRSITATDEFKEIERMRSIAQHNEAAALRHAAEVERGKWQVILADKDAALAGKDAALADKEEEIETLRKLLAESNAKADN